MKTQSEPFTAEEQAQLQGIVHALAETTNRKSDDAVHPFIILIAVVSFAANVVAQFVKNGDFIWHDKVIEVETSALATFSNTYTTLTGTKLSIMQAPPPPRRPDHRKGVARD